MLESICSNYSKSIIIGDINLNLLNDDKVTSNYKNILTINGYVVLNNISIDHITRSSNSVGTIIDHALTSLLNLDYDISLSDTSLSDHKLLLVRLNKTVVKSNSLYSKTVLDYNSIFDSCIWLEILNSSSFDELITSLRAFIIKNTKIIKNQYCNNNHKSWMNKEITDLIKKRELFYHLKKRAPNNEYVIQKYEFYSKQVVYKIRVAKKLENKRIIESTIDKPVELWKQLKFLMFNKISESNSIYLSNGTAIQDNPVEIADRFNEQFVNAPLNLTKHFLPIRFSDFSYIDYQITSKLDFSEISSEEVSNIISELNSSAATDLDQISTKFLKFCSSKLSDKISILLNQILIDGQFPDSLKCAKVVPFFKSGLDPNNYRPISILSALSKLAEKAILNRFNNFLLKNNIIYSLQFGFIKKSNTMAACVNLTNFLSASLDKKKFVGALFLDLKKAFDTVNHEILLLKLYKLGLSERQLKLFSSYLSGRMQQVSINGASSSFLKIKTGVLQGSILGPCLFTLFINDLLLINLNGLLQLYADDAVLLYDSSSQQDLHRQMQLDLSTLEKWFNLNKLVLNHDKTKFMLFGNKI